MHVTISLCPSSVPTARQVVRARKLDDNSVVAIKIIKNRKPFARQARIEMSLLVDLNDFDPDDSRCIGTACVGNWHVEIKRHRAGSGLFEVNALKRGREERG